MLILPGPSSDRIVCVQTPFAGFHHRLRRRLRLLCKDLNDHNRTPTCRGILPQVVAVQRPRACSSAANQIVGAIDCQIVYSVIAPHRGNS